MIREDPYEAMERFRRRMDKLFRRFLREVDIFQAGMESFEKARVEIKEEGDKYLYIYELPGIKKEDIEIDIVDNNIILKAKRKEEKEEKKEGYYYSERNYQGFYRVLPLPVDGDTSAIKAKYNNGVLTVEIKKKKQRGKKIKID